MPTRRRVASRKDGPPPFTAVAAPERRRLSDVIVAQIERLIVDGALSPGEALPAERDLARRLSVSRPSLREALLKMEARGLIQLRRGGGFAVTDVTAPTIAEPLAHVLNRYPKAALDLLEMRHALEAVAAALAARRATPADLRKLQRALAAMDTPKATRDSIAGAEADAGFHLAVAEASHNVALVHVTRGIFNLMRTSIVERHELFYGNAENRGRLHAQHRAIFAAIRAGDPRAARNAAHAHLDFVQATLRGDGADRRRT